jgi:tyrosine-protein kinase Etk/Wzc
MSHPQNINIQEETDFKKIWDLIQRNYKLFILCLTIAIGIAFLINRYAIPQFSITSSVLIKEKDQQGGRDMNDYLNSSLFGKNQNFQNELWVIKSTPVIEQTVRNLDLSISYYNKGRLQYYDAYKDVPFKVTFLTNHPQLVFTRFNLTFLNENYFQLKAEAKRASFYNFDTEEFTHQKENWIFTKNGKFGELIETPDLSFVIQPADSTNKSYNNGSSFGFVFKPYFALRNEVKGKLNFSMIDKLATVIRINMRCESQQKGIDIVNELMNVYSEQNLERKNHTASITIDYIEKQLSEIADSLSLTEENLQRFRSSNQLLNISDQASNISTQYRDLQNQLDELVTRKKYYDYVSNLLKNDNFSNIMLPASIGISDPILNNLISELISSQAQRSNLIENNQERNPLVPKLTIQIENLKKTISENISAVAKSTSISIEEMNKRIRRTEAEITRLPATQRQLTTIERKFRLNDAIYDYLLEKHAEAKITKASNLPDDIVVEPAMGVGQVSPNSKRNYLLAFFMGLAFPFGLIMIRSILNDKIEAQDDLERITNQPVLGKILHNKYKTNNVMYEFPKSDIAESFRALRTNLDFYVRGDYKKVIMVTSCLENEGKSFVAQNLAMSYAQLGRNTILIDFDLRKPKTYFKEQEATLEGLSSYMINKTNLDDIILKSPNDKLDYIIAGILPPNPVELLALDKTVELIRRLKKDYDIIVLDTTPLAQVSDAYLLIDLAEVKILVSRQNYTLKKVFSLIMKDLLQKNVSNICIVLNDNRFFSDQYGYGYGYQQKGIFKRKRKRRKHLAMD